MLIVFTLNSSYIVKVLDDVFEITKVAETPIAGVVPYIALGETRRSKYVQLQVGARAEFDGWHTSKVTSIQER